MPQIAIFGNEIFQSEIDIYSSGLLSGTVFYLSGIIELILGVWTLVLMVIGISEVQKLSIGMAILNFILPVLVIALPLVFLMQLVSL